LNTRKPFTASLIVCALIALAGCGSSESERLEALRKAADSEGAASATILAKSFLQDFPQSAEARYWLGAGLLARGDAQGAVIELERALQGGYAKPKVVPMLAKARLQSGDVERMVKDFRTTTLDDPNATAELKATVAEGLLAQGDAKGAAAVIEEALAAAPDAPLPLTVKARFAMQNNDLATAQQAVDALLSKHAGSADAWVVKGDLQMRGSDDKSAAIASFTKALELKPDHVHALALMVTLQVGQSNLPEAQKYMERLKKAAPGNLTTGLHEANLAFALGQHEQVRTLAQELIKRFPNSPQALMLAGENELRLNGIVQAEAHLSKAVSLAPGSVTARRLLAQVQIQQGQAARALATLQPITETAQPVPEALALAAEAQLLSGDADGAKRSYQRLAELRPTDPLLKTAVAAFNLGQQKNSPSALAELRNIAANDPGSSADLALVMGFMRLEQYDAALEALGGFDKKAPEDPRRHLLRARILVNKGDTAGSRAALMQAMAGRPDYMPAISALVSLDLQDKKPEDARKRLREAIAANPKNARAHLGLAALETRLGTARPEILKILETAVSAAPTEAAARVALIALLLEDGQVDSAQNAAQSAVLALPDNYEVHELLARSQLAKGETSQALRTFAKISTLVPNSPRGALGATDIHLAAKDMAGAANSLARAKAVAPEDPEVLTKSVVLEMRQGKPEAALDIARRTQKLKPDQALGWMLEGEIEFSRQNWPAAISAYRKALERPPAGTTPHKLVAALMRSGKAKEADAFAADWLKRYPDDDAFRYLLGDLAHAKGDLAGARKRYEELLVRQPNHVLALNNLAMILVETGQPGATPLAERAAKVAPRNASVLDTLAEALASDKRMADAAQAQGRAVALAPENHALRLKLARYLLESGDRAQAKAELDRLFSLGRAFKQQDEVIKLRKRLDGSA
jgi:putative PEP-CTERM system TPR-repeat lipoprotein